jgi:lysophospholipid acyltransferase (LPLAT)-like uncharacterized protein
MPEQSYELLGTAFLSSHEPNVYVLWHSELAQGGFMQREELYSAGCCTAHCHAPSEHVRTLGMLAPSTRKASFNATRCFLARII